MEQHPPSDAPTASNSPSAGSPSETSTGQPSSLHQLLQELDRKVRERTQELAAARTHIEHVAQAHRELLGRLDQELQQPISMIALETERLLQTPLAGLAPEQREQLQRIQQASASAMHLLHAIMEPHRTPPAGLSRNIQPASIRTIVEASLRAIKDAALAKNVQITLRNATQSDRILADARLVKQILAQAADYCVRHTGTGATVQVDITPLAEGQVIECAIACTVPQADLPSDLESQFAQQRQIAQQHGGQFVATTTEGNTLRLTLRLPINGPTTAPIPPTAAPELRQPNPTASPSPASQPQAPLVLLADDHPVNLKLYGNLLQHVGYRSLIAHTGAEAIQLATSHRPDLILMDIQMPDLDGIEATSQITHAPQTAGIPIICITSFAMPQDRERCFAAGARAYFCKPVNLAQLSKVMADLLKFPAGAPSPHPPA